MSFNVNNNRNLIRRSENYLFDTKKISVHSEDRDLRIWKNANHFEIALPDVIKNVQSSHLVDCYLPIDKGNQPNLNQTHVYMEIEGMNCIDELEPYPINTNAKNFNRTGGRVNSSFAVIPIVPNSDTNEYLSDTGDCVH